MEHFHTIQGEGFHQGRPAYFIRLGGCDVGCVWCDVKESWDASAHPRYGINEIASFVKNAGATIAVITGGEPLMHNLDELTAALRAEGIRTHIETSGTSPLSGVWDWVCFSPKKFKAPLGDVITAADELKVVVYHPSDFGWAEDFVKRVKPGCCLYLQPEWSKRETITPLIVEYIQKHPHWTLSLQIHKYINVP